MVQNSDSRYRYSQLFVLFKERHHHNSTGKEEPFLQMMLEPLDNRAAKKYLRYYFRPSWFTRSLMSDSATPRTPAHQTPLSMGISRKEYWSGLPVPSPGHLPDSGIEPRSPALQADSFPSEPPGCKFRWIIELNA